jgi:endonuclease/exonuclease/phosphatase family metal-dependent hydrolase
MATIDIGTWNLESGDSDVRTLSRQVKQFDLGRYDLWGFSEVKSRSVLKNMADALSEDAGDTFDALLGDTRSQDKLGIAYNKDKYELLRQAEIDTMDQGRRSQRDTLIGEFKFKRTGQQLIFAVNHFARRNGAMRREQARIFNLWALEQQKRGLPILGVGDYNFDWDVRLKRGNRSFDAFMSFNVFEWIMPAELVKTNLHRRYNSILDFIFLADPEENIQDTTSSVLLESVKTDNSKVSDHRPVVASLTVV